MAIQSLITLLEQSIIVSIIKAYGYSDRIHRLESKKNPNVCMVSAITVIFLIVNLLHV